LPIIRCPGTFEKIILPKLSDCRVWQCIFIYNFFFKTLSLFETLTLGFC